MREEPEILREVSQSLADPLGAIQHRLAVGFLGGLLFSTVFTYLAALLFSGTAEPLIWANLLFGITASVTIFLLRKGNTGDEPGDKLFQYFRSRFLNKGAEEKTAFKFDAGPLSPPSFCEHKFS